MKPLKAHFVLLALFTSGAVNAQWTSNASNIYYNSGNVGIGTISPQKRLHITNGSWDNHLRIDRNGNGLSLAPDVSVFQFLSIGTTSGARFNSMDLIVDGNLGIGTTSPSEKLSIVRPTSGVLTRFASSASGGRSGLRIQGKSNDGSDTRFLDIAYDPETESYGFGAGTNGGQLPINSGFAQADIVVNGSGFVGIGTSSPSEKLTLDNGRFMISNSGAQNLYVWSSENEPAKIMTGGNNISRGIQVGRSGTPIFLLDQVSIGTENVAPPGYKLAVDGKAIMEEVKVQLSGAWPDYVFESDYNLRSLEETKEFIKSEKRLPEIPSAKEMEANGVELGAMNMLLLKKIEELTLYVIALREENERQQKEIDGMKKGE